MSKFNKGDKVAFKENVEAFMNEENMTGKIGTVVKSIEEIGIVIVDFDGDVIKAPVMVLEPVKAEAKDQEPVKAEGITITREKFKELALKVSDPVYLPKSTGEKMDPGRCFLIGLVAVIILKHLEDEIFGVEKDND